jgi:phosphatidate cytidylyltransferase
MTRVASGAALLLLAVVIVWLAPAPLFLAAAEALLLLAFTEYASLARAGRLAVPGIAAGLAAAFTAAVFSGVVGLGRVTLDVILIGAFVGLSCLAMARWQGGPHALATVAASIFPCLYLGLPIGAMIAVRETHGREALLLLMATVIVSDTAQYYSGRAFGRRLLAPSISPKKTLEGAAGGFIFGSLFLAIAGRWWLPGVPLPGRAALGAALVGVGIAGDLFESMLKRSADLKDSSHLIPGHGGILDRIDALLFAAPVYYAVLKYL